MTVQIPWFALLQKDQQEYTFLLSEINSSFYTIQQNIHSASLVQTIIQETFDSFFSEELKDHMWLEWQQDFRNVSL